LVGGATADLIRERGVAAAFAFSQRHEALVANQERFDLIVDGCVRTGLLGWGVPVAHASLTGWKPDGWAVDGTKLGASTSERFDTWEDQPLSDPEWFAMYDCGGLNVYRWVVRPLGISSDATEQPGPPQELLWTGQMMLRWGVCLGHAQREIYP
jgi:hypothetical protein